VFVYYKGNVNERLTFRLGEKLARTLDDESRQTGLAKGEIVRQALEIRLRGAGKLSVMQRHFGAIRGPSDLSTNKKFGGAFEIIGAMGGNLFH